MFHHFMYVIAYPFLKLFYRVTVEGKDRIPKKGALIVAANHISYLDSIMAGFSVFPRSPNYFGKEELFKIPLFNLLIRALGAFPVARDRVDRKALSRAIGILKKGGTLIIFPQGTRKTELSEAYSGSSYLAYKSKAQLLPIAIIGTDKILPPGKKLPRFPKITIRIGQPMTVENGKKEDIDNLTKKTMQKIMEMMGKGSQE